MRKIVKLCVCGLAATMLVAGCSKKATEETTAAGTTAETTAAGETAAETEAIDPGTVTLGTYKGVEIEMMASEVTDEEVDTQVQSVVDANPDYVDITDRPAKEGDTVNIDYVGLKDGVAFDGGTAEGYDLKLGSKSFIDGFEDGIVGANVGDELSLNLTFPESYGAADLAGQAVVFSVTVNSIKEEVPAELNDAFVQKMSDFQTVDEFKEDTRADLLEQKQLDAENQKEYDAMQAVIANATFDCNQAAIDQQYDQQMNYYTTMLSQYGMDLETYVQMYGMTTTDFENELKTTAEGMVKQQLVVKAVAEAEGLTVEDADRQVVADQYNSDVDTMVSQYGQDAIDETALSFKVIKFITDNAVVK